MTATESGRLLSRQDLTRRLVALLEHDEAVIGGIGNTNFDLAGAGHRPQNFYMLGSMGLATSIALGVALAQPERQVFGLEGDGSLLMNLGSLATIAAVAPPNLTLIIWDNGSYLITGDQKSATSTVTDIVAVARGAGIEQSSWVASEEEFESLVRTALAEDGPHLIAARIDRVQATARPERDPSLVKYRFMKGLGLRD